MNKQRPLLDYEDTYNLRGIVMLMIIVGHSFLRYPVGDDAYYFPAWLSRLHMELWGSLGVSVFLFLSGYGLFLSLSKRAGTIDKKYLLSKVSRLFEPLVIYWIVELPVLFIFSRNELTPQIFWEIITFSIHPHLDNWFFKVIVATYVVTICLFKSRLSQGKIVIALFAAALVYMVTMAALGFGEWWFNTILCFPLGALVAYKYDAFEKLPTLVVCSAAMLVIAMLYLAFYNRIVLHIAFVFLCIYLLRLVKIRSRLLFFIGMNSLVFYFMANPVYYHLMRFSYTNFPLFCVLSIVGTFILSWIVTLSLPSCHGRGCGSQ